MQITNSAGKTLTLTYNDLLALPKTSVQADLCCYGSPVASGNWGGIQLSVLLNQTELDPSAASIDFTAQDGYKVSIPLETAMRSDVIIAYEKDGTPLVETYRFVIPQENGAMWIAMITTITLNTAAGVSGPSQPLAPSRINPPPVTYQQNPPAIQPTPTPTPQIQTPTPAPSNSSTTKPVAPPANVTQPTPASASFPFETVYAAVIMLVIAVVIASFVVYRRKNA